MLRFPALALCGSFALSFLSAADLSNYRGLQFGMDLPTAAKEAQKKPADAKPIHQRPALIQELAWRPGEPAKGDPVTEGLLYFFNGELFRVVVAYDRHRIEGMSAEDMIEGISATYGPASKPGVEIPFHSIYAQTAAVLARWEDTGHSYNLVRTGDRSSFALVLFSKRLEALAQAAIVESGRLDSAEAPQRERDRQSKRDEAERTSLEKARVANKPNFRP